jgi:ATP-dependent DNA helicase Rep
VRILREEAKALGYKPKFSIFDSADCYGIVSDLAGSVDKATCGAAVASSPTGRTHWCHPTWRRRLASTIEALAARAYRDYAATLRAYQAVDFDDLIMLPVELFEQHPEIREKWQNRLRYMLVDEYQDTNACQYKLLKLLTGPRAMFTAVGDDDQAIYGWRGADIENLRC